jgi:hypothetical protein
VFTCQGGEFLFKQSTLTFVKTDEKYITPFHAKAHREMSLSEIRIAVRTLGSRANVRAVSGKFKFEIRNFSVILHVERFFCS